MANEGAESAQVIVAVCGSSVDMILVNPETVEGGLAVELVEFEVGAEGGAVGLPFDFAFQFALVPSFVGLVSVLPLPFDVTKSAQLFPGHEFDAGG